MVLLLGISHVIALFKPTGIFPPKKITIPLPGTMGFAVPAAWEKRGKIFLCMHRLFYQWVKFYPVCGRINAVWGMQRRFAHPKERPRALGSFPGWVFGIAGPSAVV